MEDNKESNHFQDHINTSSSGRVFIICPHCCQPFDFLRRIVHKEPNRRVVPKVPLILNCSHTCCEDCIRQLISQNTVACPVCDVKSDVPRAHLRKLDELFPPNYALIGYLVWFRNIEDKIELNWVSTSSNSNADQFENDQLGASLPLTFSQCLEHGGSPANIHCTECDDAFCSYCFLEKHHKHVPMYLYKLEPKEMEKLAVYKRQAVYLLDQLKISQKKLQQLKNFDVKDVETDIRLHFSEYHAKLHITEKGVLEQLRLMQVAETNDSVIETNLAIKSRIGRVQHVLRWYEKISTNSEVNIKALYEEFKSLMDLPCCIELDECHSPINFTSNLELKNIEQCFTLTNSPQLELKLLPIEDWNNIEIALHSTNSQEIRPVNSPPQRSLVKHKTVPIPNVEASCTFSADDKGKTQKIVLTHLNDFNSFFVQKTSSLSALSDLMKTLANRPKRDTQTIVIGNIYTVLYKVKNNLNWRRGKILNVIDNGQEPIYNVFYVDYGNTQMVTSDRIKQLDGVTRKRPAFSIECKLTNPEGKFEENSHLHIIPMINNQDIYLKVLSKKPNSPFEVDLFLKKSDGSYITIRELMKNKQMNLSFEEKSDSTTNRFFANSHIFKVGKTEDVILTHVLDPFNIYITLNQNVGNLKKMKHEMSNYYENKYSACIPIEGTDVIVNHPDLRHGQWHRATVKYVDTSKRLAEVYFVDWGGSAMVGWSKIKMLSDNFIKIECQAIKVKLMDIQATTDSWSEASIEFLKNLAASENVFKMEISTVKPLQVILFQKTPSADVCINALLVDHNLAISTGNASEIVCWPIPQVVDLIEPEEDNFATQMIKKAESILLNTSDSKLEQKDCIKRQVDIVSCESPNLIYIKFTLNNDREYTMHKELQVFYQNETERKQKKKWKNSENCVVFDSKTKKYYRGCIKGKVLADKFVVYLYDFVRDLTVLINEIFIQDPYFDTFGCFTYKCYLSNIKPAGDNGNWSQLANEMLQQIFKMYKTIHIKKSNDREPEKIWGVTMMYTHRTVGNALEATKVVPISINQVLVESGLAFNTAQHIVEPPAETTFRHNNSYQENPIVEKVEEKEEEMEYENVAKSKDIEKKTITSWMSPMQLEKSQFEAEIICIDSTGRLFLRDDEMKENYADLEKLLTEAFSSANLPTNKTTKWNPGDLCTINYEGKWYRGTVLDVLDSYNISVEMLDFGSEHTVRPKHITKYIMYHDIAPLVYKVRLYDVNPIHGEWSMDFSQHLLALATKTVTVKIKGDAINDVYSAEIYLESGENLNNLVVKKCKHLIRFKTVSSLDDKASGERSSCSSSKSEEEKTFYKGVLKEKEEIQECLTDFQYFILDEINAKSNMYVLNVLKYNSVVLSNSKEGVTIDSTSLPIPRSFYNEIQNSSLSLPQLSKYKVDVPCVALHGKTKTWCRAYVYNIDSFEVGYAMVFFVDYGILDLCKLSNLRIIPPHWFKEPVNNVVAKVNIKLLQDDKFEIATMQINQFAGESVEVEVVSKSPLTVHLYHSDHTATLLYQNLIDCGYLKVLKNK